MDMLATFKFQAFKFTGIKGRSEMHILALSHALDDSWVELQATLFPHIKLFHGPTGNQTHELLS